MKNLRVLWALAVMAMVIAIVGIAAKSISYHTLLAQVQARLHPAPKVAAVAAPAPAPALTPAQIHQQLINRFYHATVLMYFPTMDGGEQMACTATAFQEVFDHGKHVGYLFLSASHCVDGKDTVDLGRDEWPDGGAKVYYHALVVAQSDRTQGVDAAVLFVATNDHFETIPVGHNPTEIGEPILNLSAPEGAPKQVFPGFISSLYLNRPLVLPDDGSNWEGFLLAQVYGEGPGSSGSMIVCENQQAACGTVVGHGPGMEVFLPIDRFNAWWEGVLDGKIPARPHAAPVGKPLGN